MSVALCCSRRRSALAMIVTILSSALLSHPATAALGGSKVDQRRLQSRYISEEEPTRVEIDPFRLVLSPTPDGLSGNSALVIQKKLQECIGNHMGRQTFSDGTKFRYALLAGMPVLENGDRMLQEGDAQTTLYIKGGIASFDMEDDSQPPDAAVVAGYVQETVDVELVGALKSTSFSFVESAGYQAITPAPTPAPTDTFTAGAVAREQTNVDDDDNGLNVALVAGVVGGTLVLLGILVALLLVRRREKQNRELHMEDPHNMSVNSSEDSVSEWTMSTATNDSVTLKSLGSRVFLPPPDLCETESFQLGRQVTLQKDRLHTSPAWESSALPPTERKGTVLEPSHFSAKKENDDDVESGQAITDIPFLFEKANGDGEEVLLMPPTQSGEKRVSACDIDMTETPARSNTELV